MRIQITVRRGDEVLHTEIVDDKLNDGPRETRAKADRRMKAIHKRHPQAQISYEILKHQK